MNRKSSKERESGGGVREGPDTGVSVCRGKRGGGRGWAEKKERTVASPGAVRKEELPKRKTRDD